MRFVTIRDILNLTIWGFLGVLTFLPGDANATSQWSRKTGIECSG